MFAHTPRNRNDDRPNERKRLGQRCPAWVNQTLRPLQLAKQQNFGGKRYTDVGLPGSNSGTHGANENGRTAKPLRRNGKHRTPG
eukprot:6645848-Lingulodinium_polyedra.AAC.1